MGLNVLRKKLYRSQDFLKIVLPNLSERMTTCL